MSSIALDTLKLARRLEQEAQFPQAQAEATATILADTVDEAALTRGHFDLKMAEIDARFAEIDAKIDLKLAEIKAEISENKAKTEAGFAEIKAKMSENQAHLKHDITVRLGAMIVASFAVLAVLINRV